MGGYILNTWAEILTLLGRSPESGRARSEVRLAYGDLIHREGNHVWAVTQEIIARRHQLSHHLSENTCQVPQ